MRFSVGDLVAEKRTNHWYFTSYGVYAHQYSEHIGEYYNKTSGHKPLIGIIIDVMDNLDSNYYIDGAYLTYKVMWINIDPQEAYLMDRYFFGDELRLISKINNNLEEEDEQDE